MEVQRHGCNGWHTHTDEGQTKASNPMCMGLWVGAVRCCAVLLKQDGPILSINNTRPSTRYGIPSRDTQSQVVGQPSGNLCNCKRRQTDNLVLFSGKPIRAVPASTPSPHTCTSPLPPCLSPIAVSLPSFQNDGKIGARCRHICPRSAVEAQKLSHDSRLSKK